MKASFLNKLFAILLSCYLNKVVSLNNEQNFNKYVEVLLCSSNASFKTRLLQAVWGEVRADFPDDLKKTIELYQHVGEVISLDANETHAYELQQEIRSYLIKKSVEALVLKLNVAHVTPALLNLHTFLTNNYDQSMLQIIYAKAVDELYNFNDFRTLAAHSRSIYHEDNRSKKAFDAMLQLQLHLLEKLLQSDNEAYLLHIAYYLYLSKYNDFYNRLDAKVSKNFENAINRLPRTLKYLLFEPELCLYNNRNQYLYTPISDFNIDNLRRYVFIWNQPNTVGPQGAFISNFTEDFEANMFGNLNLKVSFLNKEFKMYLYVEPMINNLYRDVVIGWIPGNAIESSLWSVTFSEGKLIFKLGNKIICTSSTYYDKVNERIFVKGFPDYDFSPQTKVCQWNAGPCPP